MRTRALTGNVLPQIVDVLPTAMLVLRTDGTVERANAAAATLFGFDPDAPPRNVWDVCHRQRPGADDPLARCAGSTEWQHVAVEPVQGLYPGMSVPMTGRRIGDGPLVLLIENADDNAWFEESRRLIRRLNSEIAAQQELRQRLDRTVRREQELHRELIHRMKNNLSMLAVVIRSRKAASRNEEVHQALADVEGRIRSIALVHEILDGEQETDVVDAQDLLRELCTTLKESIAPPTVELRATLVPYRLHITDATPLCLLANELMTNAIKHAFPGGGGRVDLELRRLDDGRLELIVADNGRGLSDQPEHGTGSRLVEALASQMRGALHREASDGVCWRLSFLPVDPEEAGVIRGIGDAA